MTTERLLIEAYASPVRVDRDAGVIHDALLLGPLSRNGVSYPDATRQDAVALFEGARGYLSHTGERTVAALKKPRRFEEQIVRYQNVRNTPEGLRGDVKVRKSHPYASLLFEMAEDEPNDFGLSPVMLGMTSGPRGNEVCSKIKMVKSIDIVSDPATTKGLFEEEDTAEEGPTAEQAYATALQQAVSECVQAALSGSKTPEEVGKEVKDLIKQHLKAFKKDSAGDGETEEADAEMQEELRTLRTEKECRVLCEDHGIEADKELMALLMDLPDKDKRVNHLNFVKRSGLVRKVKSGFKTNPTPPPATETKPDLLNILRS